MPCRNDDDNIGEYQATIELSHKLTAMLCDVMTIIEEKSLRHLLPTVTLDWWEKHKLIDERRKKEEARQREVDKIDNELSREKLRRLRELGYQ